MQIYKIVFSPTGGTEKVADILCRELGKEVKTIDLSRQDFEPECKPADDVIAVIAIPSFGGRAPKIAIDRLKKIKANGAKAVVVAVYGNREQEDTLIEMSDVAKDCGFKVIAGIEAIAEHSIVHQYATGRPNGKDEEQLSSFAKEILSKTDLNAPEIPGNRPYKKPGAGMAPKATSACEACGLCASRCPVGAIDKNNPKNTDKKACINCMRCVSICPQKARTVNPIMTKVVGAVLKKACSKPKENKLYL